MKRLTLLAFVGMMASFLAGCPIYEKGDLGGSCHGNNCNDPNPVPECQGPQDCQVNETCGSDGKCHPGDCSIWGCSPGFDCTLQQDNTVACEPSGGSSGTGGASSSSSSGAGGASSSSSSGAGGAGAGGSGGSSPVVYCGNPDDCSAGQTCAPDGTCKPAECTVVGCIFGYSCQSGTCKPENPAACGSDSDCTPFGSGYLCVSGICTAPADQCSDQTQCPSGDKCVGGKCIMACTTDANCAQGYSCDTMLGICSKPAQPCTITNDCGGPDVVCVDGTCVPRSNGASCPPGTVWVENGCIPTQSASFVCSVDGQQDACAAGSICLHHNCYISCEQDAAACDNLPVFNVCKSVTTISGQHSVCGSTQNLGDECDPTAGKACPAGKVCIDGFCK